MDDKRAKEIVAIKQAAADKVLKKYLEGVHAVNPETIVGKKYEDWTESDMGILAATMSEEKLNEFTLEKKYKQVLELEG